MTKINFNSRTSRRVTAAIIFLAAVIVIVPSVFRQQSFNAIINTRFIPIHTPIEGVISSFTLKPGDYVENHQLMAVVKNIRLNESFIRELRVERNSLQERVEGFNSHILELETLKTELEQRQSEMLDYERERVSLQLKQAQSELDALRQVLQEKIELEKRLAPLAAERLIKLTDFDSVRFSVTEYRNRVLALESSVQRIQTEQSALNHNVHLGQGRNDVPYTQQRIDEVRVILSDYRARKVEQEKRILEIDRQISDEENRLKLNREVDLRSPLNGIVWKKFFADGSEVVIGSEVAQVIDCSQLFIDAEFNERTLDKIKLGQEIQYRLIGSKTWHDGTLISKSGSGNTLQDRTLAAQLQVEKDSARLIVKINPDDLPNNSGDFCHVGRKVEISLPRVWTQAVWITRITSLFQ